MRLARIMLALSVVASCGDEGTGPDRGIPAALEIVSGNLQQDTVGQELAEPLVVKVVDAHNRPISGQIINFRIVQGGGAVFAGVSTTDSEGEARERWTLGPMARDTQQVEARAIDTQTGEPLVFATFSAVGVPDRPVEATAAGGDLQLGDVGDALADSLGVTIVDRYGNGVAGHAVNWSVERGHQRALPQ